MRRQVTEDGKYVPPPAANSKASYATMVYVRATIVEDAGWLLARSVTIAVRPPLPSWRARVQLRVGVYLSIELLGARGHSARLPCAGATSVLVQHSARKDRENCWLVLWARVFALALSTLWRWDRVRQGLELRSAPGA